MLRFLPSVEWNSAAFVYKLHTSVYFKSHLDFLFLIITILSAGVILPTPRLFLICDCLNLQIKNLDAFIYFMYMLILTSCMYMHRENASQCLGRSEENDRFPEIELPMVASFHVGT